MLCIFYADSIMKYQTLKRNLHCFFCFLVDAATDLSQVPEPSEPQSTEGIACVEPSEVNPSSSDTEDTEVTKLSDS
jgi:hypothetical protein